MIDHLERRNHLDLEDHLNLKQVFLHNNNEFFQNLKKVIPQ